MFKYKYAKTFGDEKSALAFLNATIDNVGIKHCLQVSADGAIRCAWDNNRCLHLSREVNMDGSVSWVVILETKEINENF